MSLKLIITVETQSASLAEPSAPSACVIITYTRKPEEDSAIVSAMSVDAETGEPLNADELFRGWLAFTGYVAKQQAETPEGQKRRALLASMAAMWNLDLDMQPLPEKG